MPTTRTPRRLTLLGGLLLAAVLTGVVQAGSATALEDPQRPQVTLLAGPSCGPGAVRVQVTGGSVAQHVALVFGGTAVQDDADVAAGATVELDSPDVDRGVTVDVSVAVTDADGTPHDPVGLGTYTRPSEEDCAAIGAAPGDVVVPSTSAPAPSGTGTPAPPSGTAVPPDPSRTPSATPGTTPSTGPVPTGTSSTAGTTAGGPRTGAGTPGSTTAGAPAGSTTSAATSSGTVAPGGVVRVRATGFAPGEQVRVTLAGSRAPLATVAADAAGGVEAVVQIPRGADPGAAAVELVGADSAATAGVPLQVAARSAAPAAGSAPSSPVTAVAGVALLVAAGGLGLTAARRPRDRG